MPLLFLLFLAVPVAELYLIVQSSHAFGFANTLGALIVISLVGAWLVRREGMRVWQRFNQAIGTGQVPSKEIADGVCVLGAGALLMTPGFLTDIVGLFLLLPPTRAIFRRVLVRRFTGRSGPARPIRITYRGPSGAGGHVYDTTAESTTPQTPPTQEELEP